jgi:hypothetical protein
MTKNEMKEHTKELYTSAVKIFKDKQTINLAIFENVFEDDYMKAFVLLLSYFKLADVPNEVLEICIDGRDIPQDTYEVFYEYCQNKWLFNAYADVRKTIKDFEEGKF